MNWLGSTPFTWPYSHPFSILVSLWDLWLAYHYASWAAGWKGFNVFGTSQSLTRRNRSFVKCIWDSCAKVRCVFPLQFVKLGLILKYFLTYGWCLLADPSWRMSITLTISLCSDMGTPWVCQTLPMEALAQFRLRQGRQQALGAEIEAETSPAQLWPKWAQASPETGALSSGNSLKPFTRNGKKVEFTVLQFWPQVKLLFGFDFWVVRFVFLFFFSSIFITNMFKVTSCTLAKSSIIKRL